MKSGGKTSAGTVDVKHDCNATVQSAAEPVGQSRRRRFQFVKDDGAEDTVILPARPKEGQTDR
jgi:hypothetical protein